MADALPPRPDADTRADVLLTRRAALQRAAFLLGGALAAPTIAGVLAGCGRDAGSGGGGAAPAAAYRPRALTPDQDRMVAAIAEHILPATETPGARDARVHEFVDRMLADYHPAETRARVAAGLGRLDARARRRHGRPFVQCTEAQQYALVDALDAQAFGDPTPAAGPTLGGGGSENSGPAAQRTPATQDPGAAPGQAYTSTPGTASGAAVDDSLGTADPADAGPQAFFRTLKELTVVGYYTSEAGATRELRVNPMGRYRADVPYAELGAGWA